MAKITASDLNIRVTIWQPTITQDAGGGSIESLINSRELWAKKTDPSGRQLSEEAIQTWQYDTKFTIRYNSSIKNNYVLFDATGRWAINNISVGSAGYKEWIVLSCSKIDDTLS